MQRGSTVRLWDLSVPQADSLALTSFCDGLSSCFRHRNMHERVSLDQDVP